MIINEAIILAGGFGTRLRSAVPDLPKCMAPIAGKPFLSYLLNCLQREGITSYVFSLGYMHEAIEEFLQKEHSELQYTIVIEEEPLGTGGAIRLAMSKASAENSIVVNGDTLFEVDLQRMSQFHHASEADCTIALKPMNNFDRYGVVELNKDNTIASFKEKNYYDHGYINGGVYALNKKTFLNEDLPTKFSFEKDYLEKTYPGKKLYGFVQDKYFIDIGIPGDFERAQLEFELKNA